MIILITVILLYTLLFALYLELNPNLTNIWYRIGSDGVFRIYPSNFFNFICKPLTTRELWHLELLDCNYLFGIIIIFTVYYYNIV